MFSYCRGQGDGLRTRKSLVAVLLSWLLGNLSASPLCRSLPPSPHDFRHSCSVLPAAHRLVWERSWKSFPSLWGKKGRGEKGGNFLASWALHTMNPFITLPGTGRMPDQLVILNMKHGVEAKNYEEVHPCLSAYACDSLPNTHML